MEMIYLTAGGIVLLALLLTLWMSLKSKVKRILVCSWGDLDENRILSELIDDFRKLNPDIHVLLKRIPYGSYTQTIMDLTAEGRGPEVIFVEVNNFADFLFQDFLEPLDSYAKADSVDFGDFYPALMDRFSYGGKTYVAPRDIAPWCLVYYNKSTFDEAGVPYPRDDWDWDQFVETALKVQKIGLSGEVLRWGFIDDKVMPNAWVLGAGGTFTDDVKHPTRWTFATDPNTRKGVQFRADLIHKHKVTLPPSRVVRMEETEGSDMFRFGTTAMYISGLKWTPLFRGITNFQWDVAMLPKCPGGARSFSTGGSGYGVSRHSPNKKAAWKLVKFLAGEEAERKRMTSGLAQPALRTMAYSPVFLDQKDPRNKKILVDATQYVKYMPLCSNWREVETLITAGLENVWEGKETVEVAMEKLRPILSSHPPLSMR